MLPFVFFSAMSRPSSFVRTTRTLFLFFLCSLCVPFLCVRLNFLLLFTTASLLPPPHAPSRFAGDWRRPLEARRWQRGRSPSPQIQPGCGLGEGGQWQK